MLLETLLSFTFCVFSYLFSLPSGRFEYRNIFDYRRKKVSWHFIDFESFDLSQLEVNQDEDLFLIKQAKIDFSTKQCPASSVVVVCTPSLLCWLWALKRISRLDRLLQCMQTFSQINFHWWLRIFIFHKKIFRGDEMFDGKFHSWYSKLLSFKSR